MSLLLDAVHASVPKGFAVDVLKPDSVLRDERVRIEEMSEVSAPIRRPRPCAGPYRTGKERLAKPAAAQSDAGDG